MSQYDKVFGELKDDEAHWKFAKILRNEYKTANVIWFNSGKFDLNLILAELNNIKIKF